MDPIGTHSQSAECSHGQHHMLEVAATVACDRDIWMMSVDPTTSVKYSVITYSLPSVRSGRM